MKHFLLYSWWLLVVVLLPNASQAQSSNAPTATISYTPYASALRVGCPYRFTIALAGDPCYYASSYAWDACPAGAAVTAGGGAGDNFIELTFSSPSTGSSQAFGATAYVYCLSQSGSASPPVRAVTYIRADYGDVSATAYTSQNPVCQFTPFTLTLRSAQYVTSCIWQQKSFASPNSTWTDIQNSATSNAANGFAYTVSGLYYGSAYRAKLTGCTSNSSVPTYYSSEVQVNLMDYANAGGVAVGTQDVVTGANQGSVFITGNTGALGYWQYSQDNGATWTTVSQVTEELKFENLTATTLYRAASTLCGNTFFSTNCMVRVYNPVDDISWTETKVFDLSGSTLTGNTRTYFDKLAKPLQNQVKSLSTGKVLATQPLYGKYDQAVGSTLAAPITPADFTYQPAFITPVSAASAPYDYSRFDDGAKVNAPEPVSSATQNTLGWYYSANNTVEKYTPITSYPYSRTDAIPDGSTGVSRMAGPGPGLQLGGTTADGKTHEIVQGNFPVRTELDIYTAVRNSLFSPSAIGGQVTTMKQAAVQHLSTDADGNTTLAFADKEGHSIMSARPATTADYWLTINNTVEVGWPYSAKVSYSGEALRFTATSDLMLYNAQGICLAVGRPEALNQALAAAGTNGEEYTFYGADAFAVDNGVEVNAERREAYTFFNFYLVGDGAATITNKSPASAIEYELLNTVTGERVTRTAPLTSPLAPGCYQVSIKKGAVSLSYTNRFKDISYAFYNQKGQVVASIAPMGVQKLLDNYQNSVPNLSATFATTYEYDLQGRQTAMTEVDAGRTSFVYRADGKLRFSQNAKQIKTGAFSYLGYDAIGRPVETGECLPGDNNAAFSKILTDNAAWIEDNEYGGAGLLNAYPRRDIVRTTYDTTDPPRGVGEAPNTAHNLPGYTPAFLAGRVAATAKYRTGQPFGNYDLLSQTWYSYDEQGRAQWQIQWAADGSSSLGSASGTTPAQTNGPPPAGLVGYWRMEEASGATVADRSSSNSAGTVVGTVSRVKGQWVAGQADAGRALSFNTGGTSGYVSMGDAPALRLGTTFTIEAWINPATRGNVVLSKTDEYVIYLATNARIYCAFQNGDPTNPGAGGGWDFRITGIAVPENVWTHIAISYQEGVITAYQNGVQVSQETWGSPGVRVQERGGEFMIGNGTNNYPFTGAIDEVRVWNTVRSAAQVQVDAGIRQTSSNPVAAYWRLDEGSGTTAADISGNGNTGTLKNTVNWVTGQSGAGSALSFDPASGSGYVAVADAPALRLGTSFTIEAWINPTDRGTVLLSKTNEYAVMLATDAHVYCTFQNGDPSNAQSGWSFRQTGIIVNNNAWTHIAISYEGGIITAYQNGVQVSQETWGSPNVPIQYQNGEFMLGNGNVGYPFAGALDEVRIWNTVRSAAQIQADAAASSASPAGATASVTTGLHTIDYTYDAAGNVATVCYQQGVEAERLTHYYAYDADNRLSLVQTDKLAPAASTAAGRTEHARYAYYLHGPLKRVTYGGNLQGVDYTYTAAGQLKAINDGDLRYDPGQDGTAASYGDFWGTSLHYYPNDYTSAAVPSSQTVMAAGSDYQPHYNGLVSGMSWQTPGSAYHAYGYNYDDKGQLLRAAYGLLAPTGGRQYSFVADNGNRYSETLPNTAAVPAYDVNGNMTHLQRTDGTGNAMPVLDGGYDYFANTNQLKQVNVGGAAAVSYTYDEIGEAVSQQELGAAGSKYLDYDGAGRVTALYANSARTQPIARYSYDEFGKRLLQQVYPNPANPATYTTTTFVRDAAGHQLASYVAETVNSITAPTFLYEQPIYGATRLGIYRQARSQSPAEQLYELNDQLGNTRIVFRQPTTSTYTLSMEDGNTTQEQKDFPNPTPATYMAVRTSERSRSDSPYNDPAATTHYAMGLIGRQGPTKTIAAGRGDRFRVSVYASYVAKPINPNDHPYDSVLPVATAGALGIAGLQVAPAPRLNQPLDQPRAASNGWRQALSSFSLGLRMPLLFKNGRLTKAATSIPSGVGTTPPPAAWLQCIIRDEKGNLLRREFVGMTPQAGVDWELLSLDFSITKEEGNVTVEISTLNDSQVEYAYFDDLVVNYDAGPIVEENHYYAYGQRLDGLSWRRADERLYGRGYQGQHTTQDAESGYTAFDLRMYDARYGRWLMNDPMRQHASGYVGMGNNPVSGIDVTGGKDESTHTDYDGNVVAVINDGDFGVYRHIGNSTQASADVQANYSGVNTSAGGQFMGYTATQFDFVDNEKFIRSGGLLLSPAGKIDFDSDWARGQINNVLMQSPSALTYADNARFKHIWDLKNQAVQGTDIYYGSVIYYNPINKVRIYTSARGAGNFLAGAIAARSNIPTDQILNGFGAYNMSGNKPLTAVGIYAAGAPSGALSSIPTHGEDTLSYYSIYAGIIHHLDWFSNSIYR